MNTSLNSYSDDEQATLMSIVEEVLSHDDMDFTAKGRLRQLASATERRLVREPNNTLLWYKLGETYLELHDYLKGLRANQRCYELEPLNPRAIYGLGTAYFKLSHAVFVHNFRYWSAAYSTRDEEGELQVPDPNIAQAALEQLGMTPEIAAQHAYGLFTQVQRMSSISGEEWQHLDLLLRSIESGFPRVVAPPQGSEKKGMNWIAAVFVLTIFGTVLMWFGIYAYQRFTPTNTRVAVAKATPRQAPAIVEAEPTLAAPPLAPAPLPAALPQGDSATTDTKGLTREEGDYLAAQIALQIDLDVAINALTEQFIAARDDSSVVRTSMWKRSVTEASNDVRDANKKIRALTVPERFADFATEIVLMTTHLDKAMEELATYVNRQNSSFFDTYGASMEEANAAKVRANEILSEMEFAE